MTAGRRLVLPALVATIVGGCADDGARRTALPQDPCMGRQCGTTATGRSCGICEAPAAPLSRYDPEASTYCDEVVGRCGGLVAKCADGWCIVPAGSFQAGGDFMATDPRFQPPPHRVRITRPFRIQQTEVTQGQWLEVMATNPSPFPGCGPDCPVSGMTWFDAATFANRLSEREGLERCYELSGCDVPRRGDHWVVCDKVDFIGLDCAGYRLPTEYEWEHAARAGSSACYSDQQLEFPPDLEPLCALREEADRNAWYCGNSDAAVSDCREIDTSRKCAGPHPAAQKRPNRLGLHDMYGNVEEFTTSRWRWPDEMVDLTGGERTDPYADSMIKRGDGVVVKGGNYAWGVALTCAAARGWNAAGISGNSDVFGFEGFRLVQTLSDQQLK